MVKDLTQGKPINLILRFCMPLLAGNLFQQFYNLIDTIIVGRFIGKTALSAVGSVGSLNFLVIGSVIGLCSGLAIPVAQAFGAEDYKRLRRLMAHIFYISAVLSAAITLVTVLGTGGLLRLLNTPDDIFKDAYDYIVIIFGGISATVLYNILAGVIRSVGDSKTPLYVLVFSSFLNIGLDLLFVIKFGMGVKGVAIATVVSQAVSGLICLIIIWRKFKLLHFSKPDMSFDSRICRHLLYNGLPMALQFSITAIGSLMLQACVNTLGSDIIAAMTVAGKTLGFIVLPSETIGLTMATYCGQNLGAGKIDRIKKGVNSAVGVGMLYSVMAFFIARFAGRYISLLFISASETGVLNNVEHYFGICSWFFPVLVFIYIYRNSIQGMGFSVQAMSAGVFELAARGIVGFGFVTRLGFTAACFANPMAWVAADVLLIPMYFYQVHKLQKKLTE
ncbi:MAG: MATE family efflux transporter [Acutalibacteraceae bacterium]